MDPSPTVYETLASGSPNDMVPAIRNILGGFLFSGDDVYKRVRVLSGGERTRLAVARMLLRPSNTLLLDEPTNHLDLDSKEVLLDALADYGGTLMFVSHDRYFVERLATKIIEIGSGTAVVYPGTYKEFLWHKAHPLEDVQSAKGKVQSRDKVQGSEHKGQGKEHQRESKRPKVESTGLKADSKGPRAEAKGHNAEGQGPVPAAPPRESREDQKRADAETRRQQRAAQAQRARVEDLEARIAECENAIRDIEQTMSVPGFYDDRAAAQPIIDKHQALMWKVGDLMHQWEELQSTSSR
jgi:ATP-binding cassette subfamily F protein 3